MKIVQTEPVFISEDELLSFKTQLGATYFLQIYKKNNGESQMMRPLVNKLTKEYHKRLVFYTIDYTASVKIRKKYNIEIAPSFVLIIKGVPKEFIQGLTSYNELKSLLESHLY